MMPSWRMGKVCKILVVVACIGYPLLVHFSARAGLTGEARLALALLPIAVLATVIVARANRKFEWAAGFAAIVAIVIGLEHWKHLGLAAAAGIPHFAGYAFLLVFFGRTLRPGREALITTLARRVHGELPPQIEKYSRQVTLAWCVFCVVQLAGSLLLFLFVSLHTWSFFVNVVNLPLLCTMFVGEYLFRRMRFSDFAHASLKTSIPFVPPSSPLQKTRAGILLRSASSRSRRPGRRASCRRS